MGLWASLIPPDCRVSHIHKAFFHFEFMIFFHGSQREMASLRFIFSDTSGISMVSEILKSCVQWKIDALIFPASKQSEHRRPVFQNRLE
jgi:hypothetical protein